MLHLAGIIDGPDVHREPARVCGLDETLVYDHERAEARRDLERDVTLEVLLRWLTGVQPPVELGRRISTGRDPRCRGAYLANSPTARSEKDATTTSVSRPWSREYRRQGLLIRGDLWRAALYVQVEHDTGESLEDL